MHEHGILGTIVKKSSDEGMSAFLTQGIAVGDTVSLTGPLGHFVDPGDSDHYLMISVGSGLTPIYAHFSHLVFEQQQFGKIAHIYGERYASHLLPDVRQALAHHDPRVRHWCFLSQESSDLLPHGRSAGYVQDGLDEALAFLGTTDITVFVCGIPAMVDEVR